MKCCKSLEHDYPLCNSYSRSPSGTLFTFVYHTGFDQRLHTLKFWPPSIHNRAPRLYPGDADTAQTGPSRQRDITITCAKFLINTMGETSSRAYGVSKDKAPILQDGVTGIEVSRWYDTTEEWLGMQNASNLFFAYHRDSDITPISNLVSTILVNIQDEGLKKVAKGEVDPPDRIKFNGTTYDSNENLEKTAANAQAIATAKKNNMTEICKVQASLLDYLPGLKKMMEAIKNYAMPTNISSFIVLFKKYKAARRMSSEKLQSFLVRRRAARRDLEVVRDQLSIPNTDWYQLLDCLDLLQACGLTAAQRDEILPTTEAELKALTTAKLETAIGELATRQDLVKATMNDEDPVEAIAEIFNLDPDSTDAQDQEIMRQLCALQRKKADFTVRNSGGGRAGNTGRAAKGGSMEPKANIMANGPRGLTVSGAPLDTKTAYLQQLCMFCKQKDHRAADCPKAPEQMKKKLTTAMQAWCKSAREAAKKSGNVAELRAICSLEELLQYEAERLDIEGNDESIAALCQMLETSVASVEATQPTINLLDLCALEYDKHEFCPPATSQLMRDEPNEVATATETPEVGSFEFAFMYENGAAVEEIGEVKDVKTRHDPRLVVSWDSGCPVVVAGPKHAEMISQAVQEATGNETNMSARPKQAFRGVGGSKVTSNQTAKVPVGEELTLNIDIIKNDCENAPDQPPLVGRTLMKDVGIIQIWDPAIDGWIAMADPRTTVVTDSDGKVHISGYVTRNLVQERSSHAGVDILELGKLCGEKVCGDIGAINNSISTDFR